MLAHRRSVESGRQTDLRTRRKEYVIMRSHRLSWRIAAISTVSVLLAGLNACGNDSSQAMERSAQDTMLTDSRITAALETELLLEPAVPSDDISVTTVAGVVTLSGEVPNLLAAEQAVAVAQATRGIRSVISELQVEPATRPDEEIAGDVRDALLEDPVTEAFEIEVDVTDATVTLRGEVESWAEKKLADDVAAGVRGVRGVSNLIDVDVMTMRTDEEIEREVEALLASHVMLGGALIDAEVEDGEVTLSGSIGSAAEREHAFRSAWVDGVTSVDTDGLEIRWWADDPMTRNEIPEPTDEEIRAAILDAYLLSPRVASFNPIVEVADGAVTLRGTVENLQAKREANRIAWHTVGVESVDNQLEVLPLSVMEDIELENAVRDALLRDPYLPAYDITVVADDGIVTLTGEVDTEFARERAQEVAGRQQSVIAVVNMIDVDADWIAKPDEELEADVRAELFWNPWVPSERVAVTVVDGEVTLTGTVDSWFVRHEAEMEAYEAGALHVNNALLIDLVSVSQ
jgi:osmotically-inducible protein OsmY